ncbi:MAG: sigma factor [Fimbriimonas sp.]
MQRVDLDRLAELAQGGDREAEAKAFAALAPLAEAIARDAKIPGVLPEDLTALAYERAIKAIRTYVPGEQSLKSYCRKIVQRVIIDEARKAWRRPLVHSLDAPDEGADDPLVDFVPDARAEFGEASGDTVDHELLLKAGAEERMHRVHLALAGDVFAAADREVLREACESAATAKRLTKRELKAARKRIKFAEAQPSMFADEAPPPLGPVVLAIVHREVVLAQIRSLIGLGMTSAQARRTLRLSKHEMRSVMHALREEYRDAA